MIREASIELFTRLGVELASFGTTAESDAIITRSIEHNGWFTREDVLRAVDAIRTEMLDGAKLREWAQHYPTATTPRRVAVIMAGNIPLVGFFDLLCVILSGHACYLKASSKDSVLMGYVVERLKEIAPEVPIYAYNPNDKYDMAIATGGDDANRYFREHFHGTRTLLRGSRHSVAILDGSEREEELRGLTLDITAYSGLGCRSVSMIFLPRGTALRLPHTTPINPKMAGGMRSLRALYTLQQRAYVDYGAFIALHSDSFPAQLGIVSLVEYDDIGDVEAWIDAHKDTIQCIATHMPIAGAIPLGRAQYPTLWDYADGCDTMQWLGE